MMDQFSIYLVRAIGQLNNWRGWAWLYPSFFWLFLLVPFLALPFWWTRKTVHHPEEWLFKAPLGLRLAEAAVRYGSAFLGVMVFIVLALVLAHPVVEKKLKENLAVPPRYYGSIDTSGSMNCVRYAIVQSFFEELLKINSAHNSAVAIGPYFFSDVSLIQMFPSRNDARTLKVIRRFGPSCSGLNVGTQKMSSAGYGTGQGTEPGPNLWDAVVDALQYVDSSLWDVLRSIQYHNALNGNVPQIPLASYFQNKKEVIEKVKKMVRGVRIGFATDTEFGVRFGEVAVGRVLDFATLVGLPVDLIVIRDELYDFEFGVFIKKTGGDIYFLGDSLDEKKIKEASQKTYLKLLQVLPLPIEEERVLLDHSPRFSLLIVALVLFMLWVLLRAIRPIIDY